MRMDTEPLPTNQARPLMYVPIIKNIYMCIYLWMYEECSEFNLVLVIKDQGTALVTIDYIKKKPTDFGVSSYS